MATAVGGTVSEITGGKFGNGAFSALFAFVANRMNEDSKEKVRKKKYSIKADDGTELNPEGYVIKNETVRNEVKKLYEALKIELGTDDFEFQVTGGDRYGTTKVAYSSTDDSLIGKSGAAHLRGDAVDLRIKYKSGGSIPLEITKPIVNSETEFIYDPNALPNSYSDKHHHLQLPRKK